MKASWPVPSVTSIRSMESLTWKLIQEFFSPHPSTPHGKLCLALSACYALRISFLKHLDSCKSIKGHFGSRNRQQVNLSCILHTNKFLHQQCTCPLSLSSFPPLALSRQAISAPTPPAAASGHSVAVMALHRTLAATGQAIMAGR